MGRRTKLWERESRMDTHAALTTVSAPIRSGPRFPHCMCRWVRHLSRVKLAVMCGARSAVRRWSSSNGERRYSYELTHCVHKYNGRFIFIFRAKRSLCLRHFRHRRDGGDGCFWLAREEKDSRASHKRRWTSINMARGVKWWELTIGLAVWSGGEREGVNDD